MPAMRLLLIAVVFSAFGVQVQAEEPRFGDTFTFMLGGMPHKADGSFSSTREDRPTRDLSIKDLGLDDRDWVFWGSFDWRFAERWELGATYTNLDVSGLREFQQSGNFEDLEWDVGATLDSSMKMNLYIVDVSWDFLKSPSAHLGLGLGLHVADIDLAISASAQASVNEQDGAIELGTAATQLTAPLPNLTLDGGVLLGSQVYVSATLGYFALGYGDYDGRLLSAQATAEWRPFNRVGLGVGYQYIDMNLDVSKSNKEENYNLELNGPMLFVSFGF